MIPANETFDGTFPFQWSCLVFELALGLRRIRTCHPGGAWRVHPP
jgi:hypothetical protein